MADNIIPGFYCAFCRGKNARVIEVRDREYPDSHTLKRTWHPIGQREILIAILQGKADELTAVIQCDDCRRLQHYHTHGQDMVDMLKTYLTGDFQAAAFLGKT